jgi:hypothetical protein
MNLGHLMRVLSRFRIVVVIGLILTFTLTLLSYVRVDYQNGLRLKYRQSEKWESHAKLWITLPRSSQAPSNSDQATPPTGEDLAVQIAGVATGDTVLGMVRRIESLDHVTIGATPGTVITANGQGVALPTVDIDVTAPTAVHSARIANFTSQALRIFVSREQRAGNIPKASLHVLNVATESKLVAPRSKTLPIIVFLTGLMATVGLVSILENLRPRVKVVSAPEQPYQEPPANRRTGS